MSLEQEKSGSRLQTDDSRLEIWHVPNSKTRVGTSIKKNAKRRKTARSIKSGATETRAQHRVFDLELDVFFCQLRALQPEALKAPTTTGRSDTD